MSMACSIEAVSLFSTPLSRVRRHRPRPYEARGGVGKYILKRAVEDILPHDIVYRKKMGFPRPSANG